MRAVEKIIFWKKVTQNCWMSCTFKASYKLLLFTMLTVIQKAMTGTMDYCSEVFLVNTVTVYILFMQSMPRNTVNMNSTSLPQIVCYVTLLNYTAAAS